MPGFTLHCTEPEPARVERVPIRYVKPPLFAWPRPGSAAEEELVEQHLPLVRHVVGRIAMSLPAHVDADELYSAGLVGLLDAVRKYEPSCGTTFETYARIRIRGAVLDELRRLDWVPRSVHRKSRRYQEALWELEQAHGRMPTDREMARALEMSPAEYDEFKEQIRPASFVCLDAVTEHEGGEGPSVAESVADPDQADPLEAIARRELAEQVAERLARLPERERQVLALYYFEGLRLREIADAFGLTESRICQIHAQAILAVKSLFADFEYATA